MNTTTLVSVLIPTYNIIDIKIENIFSNTLIWHTAQLCKIIGKRKALKIMKPKDIIKKYPKIKSKVLGLLSFRIPFKFILFGIEIDKKFIQLFSFGFSINIRRNKYV